VIEGGDPSTFRDRKYIQQAAEMDFEGLDFNAVTIKLRKIIPKNEALLFTTNLVYREDQLIWRCDIKTILDHYNHIATPVKPQGKYSGPVLALLGEKSFISLLKSSF
jgi:hypothetical protein